MSRTSRKNVNQVKVATKTYRAAGYIRLSVVKNDHDRDSIENQKSIIKEAIAKQGDIELQRFYIDENASGTSFERKEFQKMMQEINQGNIDCIGRFLTLKTPAFKCQKELSLRQNQIQIIR